MTSVRRQRLRRLSAAVLAWAGAAVGCVAEGTPVAAHHQVTIEDLRFRPTLLRIAPGDTVTWTNRDVVPHTVTGAGWDSGELDLGDHFTRVVTASELGAYACRYHPTMAGALRSDEDPGVSSIRDTYPGGRSPAAIRFTGRSSRRSATNPGPAPRRSAMVRPLLPEENDGVRR